MDRPRPWVALATFCENVLHEKDDVISAMRIIDSTVITVKPTAELTEEEKAKAVSSLKLVLLLSLRSGDYVGRDELVVTCVPPEGVNLKRKVVFRENPEFTGGHGGVAMVINLNLSATGSGVYWFDVTFGGDMLTRIPLNMTVLQPNSGTRPGSDPPTTHESRTH